MWLFSLSRSDSLPRPSLSGRRLVLAGCSAMLVLSGGLALPNFASADAQVTPLRAIPHIDRLVSPLAVPASEAPFIIANQLEVQEASADEQDNQALGAGLEEPSAQLAVLLEALADSDNEEGADALAREIQGLWSRSGSDVVDLLMVRASVAISTRDYTVALDLLDTVVALAPDYVEGWNRRATVHFLRDDYALSISDVEQVLRLEPRHFGALSGIGVMLDELGRDTQAILFLEEALRVHPYLGGARQRLSQIERRMQGAPI